jgi:cytochrome c oxidase cbb3-type subunit 3
MKTIISFPYKAALLILPLLAGGRAFGQDGAVAAAPAPEKLSVWSSGTGILMVMTIVILAAVILILGKIVKTLIEQDTLETARKMKAGKGLLTAALLLLSGVTANAQDAAPAAAPEGPSMTFGMETPVFWSLMGVLIFEFIVILVLVNILYAFLLRKGLVKPMASTLPKWLQWNAMMGNDIPLEKDAELMTDHDYDGIQELDNGMPPFLKYMFVGTVLFAVYYWVDYHVIKASPLQIAEYEAEIAEGQEQKLAYLKKAGASVDENTVKLQDDPGMLAAGEKIYKASCVACHGDKGQGGVGPNLTDNYWIHGGDIQSVFKTIKYGVPDKGMRAWQSEIKPGDMQAVSSYILKNLTGTNVAGGKAPQGELFNAAAAAPAGADSAASAAAPADSAAAGAK